MTPYYTPTTTANPTPTSDPFDGINQGFDQARTALGGTIFHWLMIFIGFGIAAVAIWTMIKRTPESAAGWVACGVAVVAGCGLGIWQWMRQYERVTGALDDKVTGEFPAFVAGWPVIVVIFGLAVALFQTRGRYGSHW